MLQRLITLLVCLATACGTPAWADVTVNGQLKNAQAEILTADPTGKDGRLYWNTSTDSFKWYDLTGSTWRVGVDTTSAQTLTGKDYDGGTASNTSRLTVPKAAKSTLDGLTRKAATVVYASDVSKLYVDDGSQLKEIGSGSGEKNYVQSPSSYVAGANGVGWYKSGTLTASTTTTAANLPRANTTGSGITIASGGAGDYLAYCFTIDSADKSRKLKAQWDQKPSSYATGDFDIQVASYTSSGCGGSETPLYNNNAETSTDIPNYEGMFAVSFDTTTADYYGVKFIRRAGTSTNVVSDVTVGPGVRASGAAVGDWISWGASTATNVRSSTAFTVAAGTAPTFGTIAWNTVRTRRIGDTLQIQWSYAHSGGSPAAGSGTYLFTLPTGYTIDSNKVDTGGNSSRSIVGFAQMEDATKTYEGSVEVASSSALQIRVGNEVSTPQVMGSTTYSWASSTLRVGFTAYVPIQEWSGAGTVNLIQDETLTEWQSYPTTPTILGETSNPTQASNAVVTAKYKRTSDMAEVQYEYRHTATAGGADGTGYYLFPLPSGLTIDSTKALLGSGQFMPHGRAVVRVGTSFYTCNVGMRLKSSTYYANIVNCIGYNGTTASSNSTESVGGGAGFFGAITANATVEYDLRFSFPVAEWRGKSVGAVGFAQVQQNAAGLVKSAGQLLGTNTSDSAAAGYVGQTTSSTKSSVFTQATATSGTWYDVTGISDTLTPGQWRTNLSVSTSGFWNSGASCFAATFLAIRDGSNNIIAETVCGQYGDPAGTRNPPMNITDNCSLVADVKIASNTTYKASIRTVNLSGSCNADISARCDLAICYLNSLRTR